MIGARGSQQVADTAGLIPFVFPPTITKRINCGTGMIVPVTVAANTPITVVHGLGRKIQAMWCISNNGGAAQTPRLQWGTSLTGGVSTTQKITVQGDVAMTSALLVMF